MGKIVLYPDKNLKKKAKEVKEVDAELVRQVEDLRKTLELTDNGAGLAGPQIGINKRMIAVKDRKTVGVEVYVNPEITKFFGEREFLTIETKDGKTEDFLEGCLSFPNIFGTVKRYFKIEMEWQELKRDRLERRMGRFSGFMAVVLQHEIDHLDGVLLVDRIKESGGKVFRVVGEKMEKIKLSQV